MGKTDSNWGKCPKRYVGWAMNDKKVGAWSYICSKTGSYCDPDYCLGPDEDRETANEAKGETHEQEVR